MESQTGKVFLVVDGHPAHKANLVKSYIKSGQLEVEWVIL
jgi:hypothetical protein